jgi:pre-mRNA-splicing factor CWC26
VEQLEEQHGSFARYQDDARLNAQQKSSTRWDDPARHFVDDLKPKVQKYRVQPNRFGIEPGRAWDGVDRSNGFEVRHFMAKARAGLQKDLEHQYGVQNY